MRNVLIRLISAPVFAVLVAFVPVSAKAIEIERVISEGGIEAWLVEDHSLPIISFQFLFSGGAATDPRSRAGLANMVSGLLDEGAGELDSQSFQRRLSDESISLSFSASRDNFAGSLKTLTRNRDEAFDLLRIALTEPRFDPDSVTRIRAQILAGIASRTNDPDRIAQQTFWEAIFPGHPYAQPLEGTAESVAAITEDDLRTFVTRRLARNELIVGVVGDMTADELKILLDKTFGALPER